MGKRLRLTFEVEVNEAGYEDYYEQYWAENPGEALLNEAIAAWENFALVTQKSLSKLYDSRTSEARWEEITHQPNY